MKEDWLKKVEQVYQTAVETPPEEREAVINNSCSGDEILRREVVSLLSYDERKAQFIDRSPDGLIAEMFSAEEAKTAPAYTEISHYKVEKLLGVGGMGEVYLANDLKLSRRVALKLLPQNIVGDTERLKRFEREARAASALNHPNILTVYEFGEDKGVHFIASEFVDGVTLRERILKEGMEISDVFDIAIQTASALAAAHEAGITHRDIKPENIMIRHDGYVKILDFGLAKIRHEKSIEAGLEDKTKALVHTAPGAVMGTDAYMSPEQARGKNVDSRTDIWSLGVVIYEMITGKRPFGGQTTADIVVSILSKEPQRIAVPGGGIPQELEWIVSKTLSKDTDGRYQTARELGADLKKLRKKLELSQGLGEPMGKMPAGGSERSIHSTLEAGSKTSPENRIHSTIEADEQKSEMRMVEKTGRGDGGRKTSPDEIQNSDAFKKPQQSRPNLYVYAMLAFSALALIFSVGYFVYFAPAAKQKIDSIAVLPFENLSGNPDLNSLSDGLSSTLIDRMAQLPQLKVISRNSSFKFRGAKIDSKEVADKLGVRALVTGSISQAGDSIIIRIDVEDVIENTQLTGIQVQRKANDLAGLQGEIAQTMAERLRITLTSAESNRLAGKNTDNTEAFRYYLNGLVELNGPKDIESPALDYFEKSVAIDPDFAAPYAEIAWIYYSRALGSDNPELLLPKVRAATEKALSVDPSLAKAHVMQAFLNEQEFDWKGAEREYKRAIELSPNYDFARTYYGVSLSLLGRHDEAMAQLAEQSARDPLNKRFALLQKAWILVNARNFDGALQAYQEAQAVDPDNEVPQFALAYAYAGKGMNQEAATRYKKAIAQLGGEGKYSQPLVYLAALYAKMPGKQAEGRALLAKIEAMPDYKSPALFAAVYSAYGDNDKAMELLETAYIKRDPLLRFVGVAYEYDDLRNDKRFIDLLRRIGIG